MTLRRRLTLAYGMLIAFVVGVAFALTYVMYADHHDNDIDAALTEVANQAVAELFTGASREERPAQFRLPGLHGSIDEPNAVWFHPEGGAAPVALAGPTENPAFVAAGMSMLRPGFSTSWTEPGRVRSLAVPVEGIGRIVVAADLRGVDGENAQLRGILALIGLATIAAGVAGAWGIAGRALRPVADLTATAESVAQSHDPSRRVEASAAGDELSRLGRTFNAMLSSLEASYQAQQQFVSDVSHELRTPLTTIRGNAELLVTSDRSSADEVRAAAAQIVRESGRLSRLVNDLLAVARADAGPEPLSARPVQLDEVVMEVFDELRGQPGAPIRVSAIDPVTIAGERDRLKEVLIAILDNARRYTPADGAIEVALRSEPEGTILTVVDTGIGIAPEDVERVFVRFWRSEAARRRDPTGSGLGLAIVKWIVDRHGGSISVEPVAPRGTRVTLRFPLAHPAIPETARPQAGALEAVSGSA